MTKFLIYGLIDISKNKIRENFSQILIKFVVHNF